MKKIIYTLSIVLVLGLNTNAQIQSLAGPRIGTVFITESPVSTFLNGKLTLEDMGELPGNYDEIAKGNADWVSVIRDFYEPFSEKVKKASGEDGKVGVTELGVHPETNKVVYAKIGRYGPMVQMGEKDDVDKPKFAKIGKDIDFASITLEQAIELLSWPKYLGSYSGHDLFVAIGKFGPYVRMDKTYASIGEEYSPETITYDEAVELIEESLKIQKNNMIPENTPHSIAAGIVYFIGQTCNLNLSKRDVNKVSEISEVTINKCYKKMDVIKDKLIPSIIYQRYQT